MVDQRRRRYLVKLAANLKVFYAAQLQEQEASTKVTATKTSEKAKDQLDGFMEAGLISQLVNKADLQKTMEDAHFDVFKMTRDARSKQRSEEPDDAPDWSTYDAPTIFRKTD